MSAERLKFNCAAGMAEVDPNGQFVDWLEYRRLERELAETKRQLAENHERAELIIFAREQAIESLQREIVHLNNEWREKTKSACPRCMGREDMSQDKSTLNWTCIQCGMHWDNSYVQGWNDAKKNYSIPV